MINTRVQCLDGTVISTPQKYFDTSILFLERDNSNADDDTGSNTDAWQCDYDDIPSLVSYIGVCCPHYIDGVEITDTLSFNNSLFDFYMTAEYLQDEVMMENIATSLLSDITDRYYKKFDKSTITDISTSIDITFSKLDDNTQKFIESIPEKYKKYTDRILAYPDRYVMEEYFAYCRNEKGKVIYREMYDIFNVAEYLFDREVMEMCMTIIKGYISKGCDCYKVMARVGPKIFGGRFDRNIDRSKLLNENGEINFDEAEKIPILSITLEKMKGTLSQDTAQLATKIMDNLVVPDEEDILAFNQKIKEYGIDLNDPNKFFDSMAIINDKLEELERMKAKLFMRKNENQQGLGGIGPYKSMIEYASQ